MHDLSSYRRSNEPIFWFLFGFGGMIIAFAFPAIVATMIYTGITGNTAFFRLPEIVRTWWGSAALFLIVFGASFHVMHRILFSLNDLIFHPGRAGKILCYALATILSLTTLALCAISLCA